MKTKKEISLIVLNYNGRAHLEEYFTSVYKQSLVPDEIIMMDNMSTDGSIEFVKQKFPNVIIVSENRFNLGTARASNVGFAHSTRDLVIFQSNDLRLDKKCIESLVKEINKNNKIGIVTSVLVRYKPDSKGNWIVDNAGGIVDKYGFGMQKYPNELFSGIPQREEVFFSYGCSFIIKRSLFKQVNGFDERMFNLNEDFDLSWRVRQLGYKIIYTKKSFAYHKGSATLNFREKPLKRYWAERNSIRMFLKNVSTRHLLKIIPMYVILLFGEMAFFLYRGKFLMFWADCKAVLWNLRYIAETLQLRNKIQKSVKKNNIEKMINNTSFKFMLFKVIKDTI
ncbi:hypothetical protein A3A93_03345 [Candidatus Roizmanbacteria bacterium RIFCSPLOWO2_01_FULL_38_12]|uniref:Glycosyltransferase 2-like domain-containing protein n=1 Tax=Candidatus Roizmanbacteria bacterium RIFCSPLOWO2_01_FULL_38_12 TaxID=1802061 RepID=A0A1F7ISN1_9BACT|nr:MAG: hypothetical protein A2861_01225 [Candidatus Roizmanbacteria bacterium RIFCSPHIGHO2_01_FULL_38_15]OGK35807.1 MAG: hypothetical protein A3F59_03630 [Candidatus Roizmanbacteria bacterium RIFCSPHIGHO2_12_FULL_38_13]OGK46381.1 MAG: hypothetical protein A3A93_03345 [Candidatus Roizmanbacteria bacterium RIFCSPLOWO2_01_FULL_38_12]